MSEFVPSMLAGSMPMEPAQKSAQMASSQFTGSFDDLEVSDFASLFADMNFSSMNPETTSIEPSLDLPGDLPGFSDPLSSKPVTSSERQNPTNIEVLAAANLQAGGKTLPSNSPLVAISGLSVQADQNSATALALQSDGKQLLTSGIQYANTITPAIQQSPAQLRDTLQPNAMLPEMEAFAVPKLEMAKSIEMLTSLQQQQNSSIPADAITNLSANLSGQPSSHAMMGLPGVSEFSNILAASSRNPEPMTATLNQPQWNNQIGDRIQWMISQGLRQAEIRLNPPELGMLEVRIQMQGDQASIQFNTAHAEVKDVLDSALPRLREMLAESGLNLADVNVSQQGQQQAKHDEQTSNSQSSNETQPDSVRNLESQGVKSISGNGIIDFYA